MRFIAFALLAACTSADPHAAVTDAGADRRLPVREAMTDVVVDVEDVGDVDSADAECEDTSADSRNCGRCGHDCFGGACLSGVCQPVSTVLAGNIGAAPGPGLYVFASDTQIGFSFPSDFLPGGSPTASTGLSDKQISGITQDLSEPLPMVYWATATGTIKRARPNESPQTLLTGENYLPVGLSYGSGHLYWAGIYAPSALRSCDVTDCAGTVTSLVSDDVNAGIVGGTAIDAHYLYWTHRTQNGTEIVRANHDGSSPAVLATVVDQADEMAVDATDAYWTSEGSATVMTCSLSACASTVKEVARISIKSQGRIIPSGIGLDATSVYFADHNFAYIYRVAKP